MLIFDNFLDFMNNANENDIKDYLFNRGTYRIYIIENMIDAICSRSIIIKCRQKRFAQYRINRIPTKNLCIIANQNIYMSNSAFNDMKKGTFVPDI